MHGRVDRRETARAARARLVPRLLEREELACDERLGEVRKAGDDVREVHAVNGSFSIKGAARDLPIHIACHLSETATARSTLTANCSTVPGSHMHPARIRRARTRPVPARHSRAQAARRRSRRSGSCSSRSSWLAVRPDAQLRGHREPPGDAAAAGRHDLPRAAARCATPATPPAPCRPRRAWSSPSRPRGRTAQVLGPGLVDAAREGLRERSSRRARATSSP